MDDSSFLRAAIAGLLSQDGRILITGCAANGVEGLALIASQCPDVVVTDLEMPVMDGAEFIARQLLKLYLPMIIFSAVRFDSPLAARARAAGAYACVAKPLKMDELPAQQQLLKDKILDACGYPLYLNRGYLCEPLAWIRDSTQLPHSLDSEALPPISP